MRHADASALLTNKTISDLDRLVVHQALVIDKLRAENERSPASYRLDASEVRQMAIAIGEIEAGDKFGVRRLEDVMDVLRPDWRSL